MVDHCVVVAAVVAAVVVAAVFAAVVAAGVVAAAVENSKSSPSPLKNLFSRNILMKTK